MKRFLSAAGLIVLGSGCASAMEVGAAPGADLEGVDTLNVAGFQTINYAGGGSLWTLSADAPSVQLASNGSVTVNGTFAIADYDTGNSSRYGGGVFVREALNGSGQRVACSGDIWLSCSSGTGDYCLPDYAGGPTYCWTRSGNTGGAVQGLTFVNGTIGSRTIPQASYGGGPVRWRTVPCVSHLAGVLGCGSTSQGTTNRAHVGSPAAWPAAPSGYADYQGRYVGDAWADGGYGAGFRAITAGPGASNKKQMGYILYPDTNSGCSSDLDCGSDGRNKCVESMCYLALTETAQPTGTGVEDVVLTLNSPPPSGSMLVTCLNDDTIHGACNDPAAIGVSEIYTP